MYKIKFVLLTIGVVVFNSQYIGTTPTTKRPKLQDCIITVDHLIGNLPLLVQDNKIIVPKEKNVKISHDDKFLAVCPGDNAKVNKIEVTKDNKQSVEVKCVNGKLKIGSTEFNSIKTIKCTGKPSTTVKTTTTSCAGGAGHKKLVEFNYDSKSIPIYETCYNKNRLEAIYSKNIVQNGYFPSNLRCDQFTSKGSEAGSVDISKLYDNQNDKLPAGYKHKKASEGIARGHLTPCFDFHYQATIASTQLYINAVPQWQRCNNGNWKALEKIVRRVVEKRNTVEVYTGSSYEVLQLSDDKTSTKPTLIDIFLGDGNKLPVPKYMWKVLIDPRLNEGIAFVQHNEPYATSLDHVQKFCDNICSKTDYADKPNFERIDEDAIKKGKKTCGGLITCCRVSAVKSKFGARLNDVRTPGKDMLRINS